MLVDTHVHLIASDLERYPLRPNRPDVTWIYDQPCSAEQFVALMDATGLEQAVLVQSMGGYTDDNRYCVDSANLYPDRFTAVVYVDLRADDPTADLERWAAAGAAGVRISTGINADMVATDDPRVGDLWAAAHDLDVAVLVTTRAADLPLVPRLLEQFPALPVAIDHCGFPDLTGGPPYANARPLFEMAAFPQVHVKVSTNALDLAVHAGGDPRDFVAELATAYGPERLQWGSDWSQTHDRPYPTVVELGRHAFSVLAEDQRHWPFADAARSFWRGL